MLRAAEIHVRAFAYFIPEQRVEADAMVGEVLRHATIAPMSVADRVVGVLAVWSADRGYSRADEELLTTIAALAAMRLTR